MGRLTKARIDQIRKLRQEGYTQKETAGKAEVHLRTVRKYDVLRAQKPARATPEQVKETEEGCRELAAEGLAYESNGRFGITLLGRRAFERFEELKKRAMLEFMAEADRPVSEVEIDRHLNKICGELLDQALYEAKRR